MPRADRLSSRLETLLEAVFNPPPEPSSLYWEIAGLLGRNQLAQVQTKIRKTLRQKEEIGPESAVLLACILHLTGFPAHRILHFLSLYVPGGIRPGLFELAVSAIFLGEPPIPAALVYDLTRYTYLEKRLLVRRSMEISEALKASLSPAVLLFLYLLSLRDDLSNENIQLIALVMKNCFPSQEVRMRIGGASLEELGEIARAWRNAEGRSFDLELTTAFGSGRGGRAFDRDSASFFLDKYFSDDALTEMRASAPIPSPRRRPRLSPAPSLRRRDETGDGTSARPVLPEVEAPEVPPGARKTVRRAERQQAAAPSSTRVHARRKRTVVRSVAPATIRGLPARLLLLAPTVCAAIVVAVLLFHTPAGLGGGVVPPPPSQGADRDESVAPLSPQSVPSVPPSPSSRPATSTYVVRPGDSLWKIFTSMSSRGDARRGWMEFLSKTQTLNGLGNPDQLQPGKVLTLSAQE